MTAFELWWELTGRCLDPDTDDVPWFDKRQELARLAFEAAMAQSRNYTTDDAVSPQRVEFANGRVVTGADGHLRIGLVGTPPSRITPSPNPER